MNQAFYEKVSARSKAQPLAETDIEAWDWNVKWWMFDMEWRARCYLAGAPLDSRFAKLLRVRIWCLARSVFVTSDGHMFKQRVAGIMKSGSYLTSSSNSRMRVMLAWLIGVEWALAMGDDALEDFLESGLARYVKLGFRVKYYDKIEHGSFNFCSHKYAAGSSYPTNVAKGLFNILSDKSFDADKFYQYMYENRSSPHLYESVMLLRHVGYIPADMERIQ